jgi:hypothetical protein
MDMGDRSFRCDSASTLDRRVHRELLRRIGFYSLACLLYFMMTLVITEFLSSADESIATTTRRCLEEAIFWAPGIVLLIPIIVYDLLQFSHQFVSPLLQLRRQLQRLAAGAPVDELMFLDTDDWCGVSESFNQIRHELLSLRQQSASQTCTLSPAEILREAISGKLS